MEHYELLLTTIALSMGASWASGINLYATVLVLGLSGATGNIELPAQLAVLENPLVIGAAGLMYCIEFFVDKTPGLDTGWDTLHTFIRIPAGALLAAGAVSEVEPAIAIAAGILGGGLSATSHATKAGTRLLINTSPEPFTNWWASLTEDAMVLAGLWAALANPVLFLSLLVVFLIAVVCILPKIWRLIRAIVLRIGKFLRLSQSGPDTEHSAISKSHIIPDIADTR